MDSIVKCNFNESNILFLSNSVPALVYYSHILILTISLLAGLYIFLNNKKRLVNKLILIMTCSFSIWIILSLIFWTSNRGDVIMTVWSLTLIIEPLIYICGLYLTLILIDNQDISFVKKIVISSIYLPIIILAPTNIALTSFDISTCLSVEGPVAMYYTYFIEIIYIIWIFIYLLKYLHQSSASKKVEIISLVNGVLILLILFDIGNIFGSFTNNWEIGEFGLLGMPIFIIFLAYNIINFNLFNLKLISTNLLVITLWILIGSLLTIRDIDVSQIIIGITFIISIFIGIILIRSTKKEKLHLEKISSLANDLTILNSSLSEKVDEQTTEINKAYDLEKQARRDLEKLNETKNQFIMITQHNLRIPITNINNKIESILINKQNNIDSETLGLLKETSISTDNLLRIADDFKDIAKLKPGSQILNIKKTNIKQLVENVLNEFKIDISNMDIATDFSDNNTWVEIEVDMVKMRDVLIVIIENAIKYNVINGKIKIQTEVDNDKFKLIIKNTGVGMIKEEKENIFNKSMYRSKQAQSLNPTGMGIGLHLSKSIVEAHHGILEINSKGKDLGAEVTVILPIKFKYNAPNS